MSPFRRYSLAAFAGDLRGGITAALIGVPTELIYGLIAVVPLGVAFESAGVVAALSGAVVAALAGAAAGLHLGQIPGSRPGLALICAALLAELIGQWPHWFGGPPLPAQALLVLFATVALAGLIQIGFGMFRLGHLVKYLPAPVLSGITCGIAILMVLQVLKPLLGVPRSLAWSDLAAMAAAIKPWSLGIGLMAAWLYVRPPQAFARIPPVLLALAAGVALYHGLRFMVGAEALGPTFALIPAEPPRFVGNDIANASWWPHLPGILRLVLPYALTIATLASIESLVCAAAVDSIRQTRHLGNRELIAQGVGNIASGLFGGVPMAATMPRTMANINAGAQTRVAAAIYALTVLAVVLVIPWAIGLVPQVATAGMLLGVGWQMFDPWSRKTLRFMFFDRHRIDAAKFHASANNGAILVGVAVTTLALGLVWALAFGVVLTTIFFLRYNQRAVVRSISSGLELRSLQVRPPEQTAFLDLLGSDIAIIEAQGPLFFASADQLLQVLEERSANADIVVLDLSRVNYVDATAGRVLLKASNSLRKANKRFFPCGVNHHDEARAEILWTLSDAGLDPASWPLDLDTALAAAEDELLSVRFDPQDRWREYRLDETRLGTGFTAGELETLAACFTERRFAAGEAVFNAGDSGDCLYVLLRGAVSLYREEPGSGRRRVAAHSAGTVIGLLGMQDGKPRTRSAVADVDVLALELTSATLDRLADTHPKIAVGVQRNLASLLAERLAHARDGQHVTGND